ncbi:hypothetical protein WJX84_002098 [Apatococcus fuscideae]|uniref:Mitochondrial import receptor subunit TOM20 n=1 Tax=Apatococcus fuscideae TaxID=2026836 RepID=A0AAW1T3L2_9CHLO
MEMLGKDELERLMFFEQAREQSEKEYQDNPEDAHALTKWGGALLELAHFRQGSDAYGTIGEAVEKFEKALSLEPKKHDALWCLGNAYTSQGFLTSDTGEAKAYFNRATDCFKKALNEEPNNDTYKKALEMTSKAPQLHAELQKQISNAQIIPGSGSGREGGGGGGGSRAPKKPRISDFWYDVGGWVCFFGIAAGIVAVTRSAPPPQPMAVR